MAGSNIEYSDKPGLFEMIVRLLGFPKGTLSHRSSGKLCYKAGIPASNTSADAPNARGDICVDTTNDEVYICTAYTSSSSFTWTLLT